MSTRSLQIAALSLIAAALLAYLAYSAASVLTRPPAARTDSSVLFTVQPGDTLTEIAARLQDDGLIISDLVFRLALERRGSVHTLQPGQYVLRPSMSMDQVIDELQRGQVADRVVTVIEGWRGEQVAEHLESLGAFAGADFLELVRSGPDQFPHDFLPEQATAGSLEGYLFPDTYFVGAQTTPREFVQAMLDRFGQVYGAQERQAAAAAGLSDHEVVILASIVEREAQLEEERAVIASVYLNRLQRGMLLQADPTVQFAVSDGVELGWWKDPLTLNDLRSESPYNTYQHTGLPPGPIASPGAASIRAVLEPAQTDYLFFVARGDGSHAFSETYEEHEQNVARFQSG